MIRVKEAKRGAPFWRWYINLGVGKCEVGCLFCYNNRWGWSKDDWRPHPVDKGTEHSLEAFQWTEGKCKQYEGLYDIMMCSVGDPFAEENLSATKAVFELGKTNPHIGDHLRVLSKLNGDFALQDAPKNTMFGATVCTLDEEIKKITMPNSAPLIDVFGCYLYAAQQNHHPTFLISEPMLKGMNLCALMEMDNEIHDFEELWVGHLNYGFGCEEYAMSDEEIIEQVRLLTDSFDVKVYLKMEVKGSNVLRREGLVQQEGTVYDEVVA